MVILPAVKLVKVALEGFVCILEPLNFLLQAQKARMIFPGLKASVSKAKFVRFVLQAIM